MLILREALLQIAKDKTLTGETKRVFLYLLGNLNYQNYVLMRQTEIAEELEIRKQHVSRAIRKLVEKGIILEGSTVNRSREYKLDPYLGWKENPTNLKVLKNTLEKEDATKQFE